jgi:hypothetical protein
MYICHIELGKISSHAGGRGRNVHLQPLGTYFSRHDMIFMSSSVSQIPTCVMGEWRGRRMRLAGMRNLGTGYVLFKSKDFSRVAGRLEPVGLRVDPVD